MNVGDYASDAIVFESNQERLSAQCPDLVDLNRRLLEEISSVQIRMIEVLRENFSLKAEIDQLRSYVTATQQAPAVVYKSPTMAAQRKHRRFMYQQTQQRAYPLLSVLPKRTGTEELDLKKTVEEMTEIVGDLEHKTRDHEPLIVEVAGSSKHTFRDYDTIHPAHTYAGGHHNIVTRQYTEAIIDSNPPDLARKMSQSPVAMHLLSASSSARSSARGAAPVPEPAVRTPSRRSRGSRTPSSGGTDKSGSSASHRDSQHDDQSSEASHSIRSQRSGPSQSESIYTGDSSHSIASVGIETRSEHSSNSRSSASHSNRDSHRDDRSSAASRSRESHHSGYSRTPLSESEYESQPGNETSVRSRGGDDSISNEKAGHK